MTSRRERAGARVELIQGSGPAAIWEPSPRVWRRASRLVHRFGPDRTLDLMDERAERALVRGRIETARAWRDLMVAVHRMSCPDRPLGEREH